MFYYLFLFQGKVLASYRKIEMLELPNVLFWVVQNFRSNSRPLNTVLEGSGLNDFDLE